MGRKLKREGTYVCVTDSFCCTTETNTTLYGNKNQFLKSTHLCQQVTGGDIFPLKSKAGPCRKCLVTHWPEKWVRNKSEKPRKAPGTAVSLCREPPPLHPSAVYVLLPCGREQFLCSRKHRRTAVGKAAGLGWKRPQSVSSGLCPSFLWPGIFGSSLPFSGRPARLFETWVLVVLKCLSGFFSASLPWPPEFQVNSSPSEFCWPTPPALTLCVGGWLGGWLGGSECVWVFLAPEWASAALTPQTPYLARTAFHADRPSFSVEDWSVGNSTLFYRLKSSVKNFEKEPFL